MRGCEASAALDSPWSSRAPALLRLSVAGMGYPHIALPAPRPHTPPYYSCTRWKCRGLLVYVAGGLGVPRDPRPAWEAALVAMAPSTKAPAWLLGRSLAGRAGRGIGWRARRPLAHQPGGAGAAGSWPPPLQCLPRCAPSAGIMGGPAAADAVVEAGRGRSLGLEGRGGRVSAGSGSLESPEAREPKQKNKTLEGAGAHRRWGGSWSRKMVPYSLSSPGPFPSSALGPVQDCFAPCLLPACLTSVFGFFCRWK